MGPTVVEYSDGIAAVDSGHVRPQLDAIHLVVEEGRVAVVDAGTNQSVPRVLDALARKGLSPDAIDYVFLTHVHLDHAGGAGLLMRHAPNATLVVHPRGARHVVDPSKLMQATRDVYGRAEADALYGTMVPVPVERVFEATDGTTVSLAGRTFAFHDTPGHARHHNCIHDDRTGHLFTGDMFGVSYRELDRDGRQFVFPATTPASFDPDAFHASIERMTALRPEAIYMTHYGKVVDVPRIARDLLLLVDAHADLARRHADIDDATVRLAALEDGVRSIAADECRRRRWGVAVDRIGDVLGLDMRLNAAGLAAWIDAGHAHAVAPTGA